MKQLGLSLVLLTAVSLVSASKVDYDLTVNGKQTTGTYEFEGQGLDIVDQFEGYFFKAHVEAREEGVVIENEISTRNEAGETVVVSQPTMLVDWEKEGVVTLGDSNNEESLKLVVHAHK